MRDCVKIILLNSNCFFGTHGLFFLMDIMANNTTSEILWPENFWGKVFTLTVFTLNEDAEKRTV